MMNKASVLPFLFLFFFWTYYSFGQDRPVTEILQKKVPDATSTAAKDANSLLYKVQGNGIATSYLFGTFHILPQKDFHLKEKVKTAFYASEQIVLELDMDDPGMQLAMMQNAAMQNGQTLDKLFTPEDYKRLDELLKQSIGIGLQMFNTFKPFMISSMLIQNYIEGTPASFEGKFVKMASESKKEILGLESVEDQLSIFDRIPYTKQAEDIVEMMNEEDTMRKMYSDMIELYKSEDLMGIYKFTSDYFDDPQEEQLLLIERNEKWIPKIGELAKDKKCFFGVGAAHLGGEKGVVQLLKKAGYAVTAVK